MSFRALGVAVLLLVGLFTSRASAHPTPGSVAFVDFTVSGARIEQDVPIEELERALHRVLASPDEAPEATVARHERLLREYGGAHLHAESSPGGEPWRLEVGVVGHASEDGPRARFLFSLEAPSGAATESIALHDDLVAHEVVSHYTSVYVRSDWAAGANEREPQLAATFHAGRTDVTLARRGSFWRGLGSVVTLGMEHIAGGLDHLLFLFALMLVAPVVAVDHRWQPGRNRRQSLLAIARIVSAFTVGHSVTLALGAFGWVAPPPAPVEAAIAASVVITAVHALRPIFPRREAFVAASFGLVHGLAFARTLSGRDLGRAQAAWTLLGFNTGIELAQLALLALVLPWLLVLSSTRAYIWFRRIGAAVAATFAAFWFLERAFGVPDPAVPLAAWAGAHPLLLLTAFAGFAVCARLRHHPTSEPGGSLDDLLDSPPPRAIP